MPVFCFLLFAVLHFVSLAQFPGFHYDEAWAANFSYRIAFEPSFWPLGAMSPYTAPWAHYWAAFFLKLFGPSLTVFRLSQVVLSLTGLVFLLWFIFERYGKKIALRSAAFFLSIPAILFQQRFAIELQGFHVFCFGLLLFSLQRKYYLLVGVSLFLGITGHLLFLAVAAALALLPFLQWERVYQKAERVLALILSLALLPFFLKIYFSVPEKTKAFALCLALVIFIFFLLLLPFFETKTSLGSNNRWIHKAQKFLPFLALPFLANLFFFADGTWILAVQKGLPLSWMEGVGALSLGILGSYAVLRWPESLEKSFFVLLLLFLGVLMLKAAPRYYHLALVLLPLYLALELETIPPQLKNFRWKGLSFENLFLLLLLVPAFFQYKQYFQLDPKPNALRFLFWKDDSRDFLSKQNLALHLGSKACPLSAISSVDGRVREALVFLAHKDWPLKEGECAYKPLILHEDRSRESGFRIEGEL